MVVAVIAESGTSPKCFLTMLSRSSSSSIVRGEHRIRFAARYASIASESRFGPCSSADSRPCPASSISSRSRRVATRRFVVPRRLR